MAIRSLTLTSLRAWAAGIGWIPDAAGQERVQPASIDSLVAAFHADPGGDVPLLTGACPRAGTWQYELLERLLEVPTASPAGANLVNTQSPNVHHCDIPALDAWFRGALMNPYARRNLRIHLTSMYAITYNAVNLLWTLTWGDSGAPAERQDDRRAD